jgi:hypothetical protein
MKISGYFFNFVQRVDTCFTETFEDLDRKVDFNWFYGFYQNENQRFFFESLDVESEFSELKNLLTFLASKSR